jgi:multimeric flavodoxin WrbA
LKDNLKLLSICGSPRKGNTEWMLTELNRLCEKHGFAAELVLLRKMDIRPCTGCLSCEKGGTQRKGVCKIEDDMSGLLSRMLLADIIVFGTPVYFELLSGMLKNFMDRTCAIWPRLKGKGCAGVAVAEEGIGKAIENIQTYASLCSMKWIGSATALAKTPRQAAGDAAIAAEVRRLADIIKAARI